jgi:hypothetical protein
MYSFVYYSRFYITAARGRSWNVLHVDTVFVNIYAIKEVVTGMNWLKIVSSGKAESKRCFEIAIIGCKVTDFEFLRKTYSM